jgi:hypothetical protein
MHQAGPSIQICLAASVMIVLAHATPVASQFIDRFDGSPHIEWRTATGDGDITAVFEIQVDKDQQGKAVFRVDASDDTRNVWWAVIQSTVSGYIDVAELEKHGHELRIETRIRANHAPRRVNLHAHTQRTQDFHTHLMEFDIPDAQNWHTIGMTTNNFDARSGDTINVQLALMDWGRDNYQVELDYFKADVVSANDGWAVPGDAVLYPPPVPQPEEFRHSVPVAESGMIDPEYPGVNFAGWNAGGVPVLTTDGSKIIVLRWDTSEFTGQTADGYGMLELFTHSWFQTDNTSLPDFDRVRLVEIFGGDAKWNRKIVTFSNFTQGKPVNNLFNSQMIIDISKPEDFKDPLRIHIPRPVIQRLLNGKTRGIALYPLGALQATFHLGNARVPAHTPVLYFNTK